MSDGFNNDSIVDEVLDVDMYGDTMPLGEWHGRNEQMESEFEYTDDELCSPDNVLSAHPFWMRTRKLKEYLRQSTEPRGPAMWRGQEREERKDGCEEDDLFERSMDEEELLWKQKLEEMERRESPERKRLRRALAIMDKNTEEDEEDVECEEPAQGHSWPSRMGS